MSEIKLSSFTQDAACANYEYPEAWQPDRDTDKIDKEYSHTELATIARKICATCDVAKECLAYSLQYEELEGIWSGHDYYERRSLRRKLGMRKTLSLSPDPSLMRVVRYDLTEGDE